VGVAIPEYTATEHNKTYSANNKLASKTARFRGCLATVFQKVVPIRLSSSFEHFVPNRAGALRTIRTTNDVNSDRHTTRAQRVRNEQDSENAPPQQTVPPIWRAWLKVLQKERLNVTKITQVQQ